MQSFDSDGVRIAYLDEGEGEPILLIHGFASNLEANWIAPNWVRTLTKAGRRVIAYDNRGHGESEKLYDPELYGAPTMAEDAP
jgi:pimeloyl-ACP methyl ester carboxylesterase